MAKNWIITLQPTDLSSPARVVEKISGRKKIAAIETHLCKLYGELVPNAGIGLDTYVIRGSGVLTSLSRAPYMLRATLE